MACPSKNRCPDAAQTENKVVIPIGWQGRVLGIIKGNCQWNNLYEYIIILSLRPIYAASRCEGSCTCTQVQA